MNCTKREMREEDDEVEEELINHQTLKKCAEVINSAMHKIL
jgi:hypothetical protein